jgi:hypothetical protein
LFTGLNVLDVSHAHIQAFGERLLGQATSGADLRNTAADIFQQLRRRLGPHQAEGLRNRLRKTRH